MARDAPMHGEHTRDVLREAGYGDGAIEALLRERAVTSSVPTGISAS